MGQGYGLAMHTGMEQQGQQAVDGEATNASLAQQRPRIRLKLRPPAAAAATAASHPTAADGDQLGMPGRLRSSRSTRANQQQQAQQPPRSRRSAAQRAREFVAAVSHAGGGSSEEEDSQPQSDSDVGAESPSGDERRGGRRRRAGAAAAAAKGPVRHSARLQKQGGVRQYRTLAEGSDNDFDSEDDA
jgi:hypothetical protein